MGQSWILEYDSANCAIGAAVGILGERSTFLVLREAFNGIRRFDDMQRRTGAPRQVLSNRLTRLVDEGILRKEPYREEGKRPRSEYRLTEKGIRLRDRLTAMHRRHADLLPQAALSAEDLQGAGATLRRISKFLR